MGTIHALKSAFRFAGPFLRFSLLGKAGPVLAGYKITNRCNLKCLHCPYWSRSGPEQPLDGTKRTLDQLKQKGIRILILEGGEPLVWRDGKHCIDHVVEYARELFPSVCMTTNGTLPWGRLALDRVWVSLDGPAEVHDSIRGPGTFARVWRNIETEGKGRAFVSTTVNTINIDSVPAMIQMLQGVVAGVTIQFHYPYHGLPDPLFVTHDRRRPLLRELIALKRQGRPVANSEASLRELEQQRWTCEDALLANAEPDGSVTDGCYLKNRGLADCSLCGFTAHNEMSLAFRGSLGSIRAGLNIFF